MISLVYILFMLATFRSASTSLRWLAARGVASLLFLALVDPSDGIAIVGQWFILFELLTVFMSASELPRRAW